MCLDFLQRNNMNIYKGMNAFGVMYIVLNVHIYGKCTTKYVRYLVKA